MPSLQELEPLPLPHEAEWAAHGVVLGSELHAGHQSRVFEATLRDGARVAVKLTDRRMADAAFSARVDAMTALARMNPSVVAPVPIGATTIITEVGDWLVVAAPFVAGRPPDITNDTDVCAMAVTLAQLHVDMALLGPTTIPPVAALRGAAPDLQAFGAGPTQLLHGDFAPANIVIADDGLQVFDLDDCGIGPVEFEVGNTLYMVLFDATMANERQRYDRFRSVFVEAYRAASGRPVTDESLDAAIQLRIEALSRWIDDPASAPIGIRTSPPEWLATLRTFVAPCRQGSDPN